MLIVSTPICWPSFRRNEPKGETTMSTLLKRLSEEKVRTPRGVEIFVRSGVPDGPARAAIAICHGVKSHSGYYFWAAEQLLEQGFAVYALDLHGRGKSDGERFYTESIEHYLED